MCEECRHSCFTIRASPWDPKLILHTAIYKAPQILYMSYYVSVITYIVYNTRYNKLNAYSVAISFFYTFPAANESIEYLDLSWNHLRRKGAIAVCRGLVVSVYSREMELCRGGGEEGQEGCS